MAERVTFCYGLVVPAGPKVQNNSLLPELGLSAAAIGPATSNNKTEKASVSEKIANLQRKPPGTISIPHGRRRLRAQGRVWASAQYVSIKYTERFAQAGIEPSVGSVGDSYDNALAETINGLYKAEVIHRRGP
jgi:transposase InsO family protein